jgi:hypothetical protein
LFINKSTLQAARQDRSCVKYELSSPQQIEIGNNKMPRMDNVINSHGCIVLDRASVQRGEIRRLPYPMIGASSRAATRSMPATARLQVGSAEEAGGFHAKAQSRKTEKVRNRNVEAAGLGGDAKDRALFCSAPRSKQDGKSWRLE